MLRLHTISKIGSSEEQKEAQDALLNDSGANPATVNAGIPKQQLQHTPYKKVQLHSQTEQQTNTYTQTPTENLTTTCIISKPCKNILQADNSTHKRHCLK